MGLTEKFMNLPGIIQCALVWGVLIVPVFIWIQLSTKKEENREKTFLDRLIKGKNIETLFSLAINNSEITSTMRARARLWLVESGYAQLCPKCQGSGALSGEKIYVPPEVIDHPVFGETEVEPGYTTTDTYTCRLCEGRGVILLKQKNPPL
jgi:hypothetical protein